MQPVRGGTATGTPDGRPRRTPDAGGADRRCVLAVLGLAGAVALTGCDSALRGPRGESVEEPTPDDLMVSRTAAEALALRVGALGVALDRPRSAAVMRRIADDHAEHARALGFAVPAVGTTPGAAPGSAPATAGGVAAEASPDPAATTAPVQPVTQQEAEWSGAANAARDVQAATDPGLAALLARIAASRAVHSDLVAVASGLHKQPTVLTPAPQPTPLPAPAGMVTRSAPPATAATPVPTVSPTLGPADRDALNRLLAGEHAAVFAYPLIVARCAANRKALAAIFWQQHLALRDRLAAQLAAAGTQPVAAQAAYDVGPVPATSGAAARLAVRVENGLAALAVDAVAATTGVLRGLAAAQLVSAARRAVAWGGTGVPLPGGGLPAPTAAASPGTP